MPQGRSGETTSDMPREKKFAALCQGPPLFRARSRTNMKGRREMFGQARAGCASDFANLVHCTINAIGVFVKFLQHAIVFRVRQQGWHRHPWEVIAPEAL